MLRAFRLGEAHALARVYDHYFPVVAELVSKGFWFESAGTRLRYRGAGASPDAFDLVHDIFTALFEESARQAYGGTAPYAAYLSTVARNRIISRLRRDKARLLEQGDPGSDGSGVVAIDGAPSPEQQVINRQTEAIVQQFLSEQSEPIRALARCRFAEDLSQEQTAAALHLSRKQVRRLELELRRGLLKRMRGDGRRRAGFPVGVLA